MFVRACIDWIRREMPKVSCVITYCDPSQGHAGDVYHAARFKRFGAGRATDQLWRDNLTGDVVQLVQLRRRYGTQSRSKLRAEGYELIERPGKVLFVRGLTMGVGKIRRRTGWWCRERGVPYQRM